VRTLSFAEFLAIREKYREFRFFEADPGAWISSTLARSLRFLREFPRDRNQGILSRHQGMQFPDPGFEQGRAWLIQSRPHFLLEAPSSIRGISLKSIPAWSIAGNVGNTASMTM
jgi:hypothetical protein